MSAERPAPSSLEIRNLSCLATATGRSARRGRAQGELVVIRDAAVRCEGERIVFAGTEADLRGRFPEPAREIDGTGKTLLPGFVDAHTHPVWAGDRAAEFARRLAGESYASIAASGGGIVATVEATRRASRPALTAATRSRLIAMRRSGTTTAEAKSGYALDVEGEIRSLEILRDLASEEIVSIVPTLLAAHEIPVEHRGDRAGWVRANVDEILPRVASARLAVFCDVFCEEGVFTMEESRAILLRAKELGLGIRIHADELARSGGALLAAELGAASADHLLFIGPGEIEALARAGTVATLLPGTAWWLRSRRAPARELVEAGVPVAVATDANPGSCNTESLPAVAGHACHDYGLSIEETLTAITLNGAASLGLAANRGSVEPGKRADLVILDAPDYRHLVYHWGLPLVTHTIIGGRVHEF
ncbi:MAG TPA: imidazolonepropionase [Thermoanaerobaculia bacterium]|nr:imidazolonepropionase [Thermoanaerobaculia bacterium]